MSSFGTFPALPPFSQLPVSVIQFKKIIYFTLYIFRSGLSCCRWDVQFSQEHVSPLGQAALRCEI